MALASPQADEASALRSVHTSNLPALFDQLQISLIVSTYQAGKAIVVRSDHGTLNTHFRTFAKPMGIAANNTRLTIGGSNTVWEYHNMPAVAQKLEPPGKHDACYIPRRIHVTGDIDIHELAWDAKNELWLVNTRFCCLCTLDPQHSFYPRWRPPFVSAYAPEDRCHLNGLAMVEGRPKYVTALGETDTAGGWRANKARGGILMDIETNEILLRGLSMPHSPRWYQGKLWVLESGEGSLASVDLKRRTWQRVAE
ncbi:MAG TPA: TIGR03032 family protein, partial [Nitrososphaera sp.]|nr:TIGR03032 family protein [Nitrososphaera sp.]